MSDDASYSSSIISRDMTAVLKLQIGVDGPVRRIALQRLYESSASSSVSFNQLRKLAISYAFPKAKSAIYKKFDVVMTYVDEDGDVITISTDDELAEGFAQFVNQKPPVLRVNAVVTRKGKSDDENTIAEETTTTTDEAPEPRGREAEQTSSESSNRNESPRRSPAGIEQLQTALETVVAVLASSVVALQTHMAKNGVGTATSASTGDAAAAEAERQNVAEGFMKDVAGKIGMKESINTNSGAKPEEHTFIHGRHTCDGCLQTPIVGTRYKASNLPDYDLCMNCHSNYKGAHIKFEPAELDRDRQLQGRWRMRQHRQARRSATGNPCGGGNGMRGRRCRQMRVQVNVNEMDDEMKEAIRLSLLEVKNGKDTMKEEKKKESKEAPNAEKGDEDVNMENVEEEMVKEMENVADVPKVELPAETPSLIESPSRGVNDSFTSAAAGNGEIAEAIGITLDHCAEAIDAIVSEFNKEASKHSSTNEKVGKEVVESAVASAMGTASANSSVVMELANAFEENKKEENQDDVSAMTNSFVSHKEPLVGSEPDIVVEPTVLEEEMFIKEEEAEVESEEPKEETVIVEPSAPVDETEESAEAEKTSESDDEWSVVNDDDEMMARAAQMIGSAIFEGDNTAESVVSSASSVPSTVPSLNSVSGKVMPNQRALWSAHLSQLRELGFEDEAKNVEILERLNAANIGVDSTDEITVTEVVNQLLNARE
eukprot:scaffold52073_cov51-Attheya_sp.AAC.6